MHPERNPINYIQNAVKQILQQKGMYLQYSKIYPTAKPTSLKQPLSKHTSSSGFTEPVSTIHSSTSYITI